MKDAKIWAADNATVAAQQVNDGHDDDDDDDGGDDDGGDVDSSTLGLLVCMVLWMLMRTRKMVTSKVIRPGMISGFTRKLKKNVV